MLKYKRILIKLSGEMLGLKGGGFSSEAAISTVSELKTVISDELEVSILLGGGNIVRARDSKSLDRLSADYMGMVSTVINSLGLKSILHSEGIEAVILSTVSVNPVRKFRKGIKPHPNDLFFSINPSTISNGVNGITEELVVSNADKYLSQKKVVIFAGGTGSPFFTTDTAAALRAIEINADILLKATRVDGVYDSDPEKNPDAKLIKEISFSEAIKRDLKIMDKAALSLLEENNLDVIVFNFLKKGNLKRIINGELAGTLISGG